MVKSYVTLEQRVCPACGKTFDTGALLLDKRLRNRFDMHTVTGFELCPDDQAKVEEGYRILVGVDQSKSRSMKPEDVHRTGEIAYLRAEVADEIIPASKGHPVVWVESAVINHLKQLAPAES